MDVRNPFATLTPTLDGPVLRVLAKAASPLTTQQVIDLSADGSPAGIRKVLRRLTDQGIVAESRVGKTYTYEANRDHLAWPAVDLLANLMQRLDQRIAEEVGRWQIQPLSVELFGSAARGEASTASDIDILVVAPQLTDDQSDAWTEQLSRLQEATARWTGNTVEVLDVSPSELVDLVADDAPPVTGDRHRVAGSSTSDLVPRQLASALTSSGWSKQQTSALSAALTPTMSRLIAELTPAMKFELPDSIKKAMADAVPTIELSEAARRAMLNSADHP